MPQARAALFALCFSGALVFPALCGAGAEDEIRTLLPKDAIPSIDAPAFAKAEEAEEFMRPGEMVIGINIEGDKRAYAVPLLSSHEIVNDVVGGRAIAVTW